MSDFGSGCATARPLNTVSHTPHLANLSKRLLLQLPVAPMPYPAAPAVRCKLASRCTTPAAFSFASAAARRHTCDASARSRAELVRTPVARSIPAASPAPLAAAGPALPCDPRQIRACRDRVRRQRPRSAAAAHLTAGESEMHRRKALPRPKVELPRCHAPTPHDRRRERVRHVGSSPREKSRLLLLLDCRLLQRPRVATVQLTPRVTSSEI